MKIYESRLCAAKNLLAVLHKKIRAGLEASMNAGWDDLHNWKFSKLLACCCVRKFDECLLSAGLKVLFELKINFIAAASTFYMFVQQTIHPTSTSSWKFSAWTKINFAYLSCGVFKFKFIKWRLIWFSTSLTRPFWQIEMKLPDLA